MLSALTAVRLPEGEWDEDIVGLVTDSAHAKKRTLFVCLRGPRLDGHAFAREAYERGCRHFLCEYPPRIPSDACVAYAPDCRRALARLAGEWYSYPEKELTLIGITGATAIDCQRKSANGNPLGRLLELGVCRQVADQNYFVKACHKLTLCLSVVFLQLLIQQQLRWPQQQEPRQEPRQQELREPSRDERSCYAEWHR